MKQVSDWLEKLGLGHYAERFAENDVSFSVLSDLTDQDLKEIGVSLGHRRQLLREIANLGKTAATFPSAHATNSRAAYGGWWRAPLCDRDVLRSGRLDRHCRAARCRGMARPGRRLSRRRFGGGDRDGRPSRQEARRRADGAVRLSRWRTRTMPSARCGRRSRSSAHSPNSTARTTAPASRSLPPASASTRAPWSSMRRARYSATSPTSPRACRRWPSRARSWSRRGCSVRSPVCSSPRSAAAMHSKACRSR